MSAPEIIRTERLADAFQEAGLPYPGEPEPGTLQRFPTSGKKGDAAGWIKVFPDGEGAVFGNWRDDRTYTWQRKRDGRNPIDLSAIREQVEQARQQAQAERDAEYAEAAARAAAQWQNAAPAIDHPYLSKKRVQAHLTRQSGNHLLVPVFDGAGNIQTLQSIAPDGSKRFMPGGKMTGGRCWIGEPGGDAVVVAEGFATAATIHEVTGLPVAVAFNAGNLLPVAKDVRAAMPKVKIVIAGDDDHKTPGNPGRTKAEAAARAVAGITAFPKCVGTDFNDLALEAGRQAVADTIKAAINPPPRFRLMGRHELRNLPPMRWRVDNVLPESGVALIVGQSQAGKSFVAIDMLARVALGLPWFDHEVEPCRTVYVGLEGVAGLPRRLEAWERYNHIEVPDTFSMVLNQPFKITDDGDIKDLAEVIVTAGGAGSLVAVDTLAQAAAGIDENSSADMGRVIEGLQTLQRMIGGLVIGIHHMGKDVSRGARGHSSLYASMDTVIGVSLDGDARQLSTDTRHGGKSKDAEPVTHGFNLARVLLWQGDDGREVTGAAIEPQDDRARIELPKAPTGGNARLVWERIGKLLREAGDARPPDAPKELPEGRPAIRLEASIVEIAEVLAVEPKRKVERTRSAITSLMNRGLLTQSEGWIWCK